MLTRVYISIAFYIIAHDSLILVHGDAYAGGSLRRERTTATFNFANTTPNIVLLYNMYDLR